MDALERPVGLSARMRRVALAAAALVAAAAPTATAAEQIAVHPRGAQGHALSFFDVSVAPGQRLVAGTIVVRNPAAAPAHVDVSVVRGLTAKNLGSAYADRAQKPRGAARWVVAGARVVAVPARGRVAVPVTVGVPPGTKPGDYLAGISLKARGQGGTGGDDGVAIGETRRYVVGVEIRVPGPRQPRLELTGASVEQYPAGVTFLLPARNTGNAILEGVEGEVTISARGRRVAQAAVGPGTFVTDSAIELPLPVPHLRPREGTVYRVTAVVRYSGGVARLSRDVTFGKRQSAAQREYPGAPSQSGRIPSWVRVALAAAVTLVALLLALLRRERRRAQRSAVA